MKRFSVFCIVVWALVALSASSLFAAIPQVVNYQGRLTTSVGSPVNDTVTLVFAICADSLCTTQLWTESHSNVIVKDGLFDAILGSITPIPGVVFDGSVRFVSISVDGTPGTRRLPLVSVGYAYRSINADTAAYAKATGGEVDCDDCDDAFVNAVGPDSVRVKEGTAFLGKAVGNPTSALQGVEGYASNSSIGPAVGGYFHTSDAGGGIHIGVEGEGNSTASDEVYGVYGLGTNTSGGNVYGGYFTTTSHGTGVHIALSAKSYGGSPSGTYGIEAVGSNSSSGIACGGNFTTSDNGTGTHYGVYIISNGSSSSATYGIRSEADNSSTGVAYGGYFRANSSGTGVHIALRGVSYGASTNGTYGSYMYAQNTSSGDVYGGHFETGSTGTGEHYGVHSESYGSSAYVVVGLYGRAENTSTGTTYGGYFTTTSEGSGTHYGSYSVATGGTAGWAVGAYNISTSTAATATYGTYGMAGNSSSGPVWGGSFQANTIGTGIHYGVSGVSSANSTAMCTGVYGYADNSGSGYAYGGYFSVPGDGTGNDVALYAKAPDTSAVLTRAGYFQGNVLVAGDFVVTGGKAAATKMSDGEYRTVYCQESPENWFEDFGEGQLVNGQTHIELDPMFLETVTIDAKHPMKVFIQLNDENCKGTAVKRGTTGFDVIELEKGTSSASFSYRVVAKRKGHEDLRLAKMEGPTPEEMRAAGEKIEAQMKADRAQAEAESKKTEAEMSSVKKAPAETDQE
jgi:hypothetical protein